MRKYWIIAVLLLTSCVPPSIDPQTTSIPPPTPRKLATLTPIQPTQIATLTNAPVLPTQETSTLWASLAAVIRRKAQQAITEKLWEDTEFKEEGYQIINQMMRESTGKVKDDSAEVLKRFRWGMEFMNKRQLQEVIDILDQYN